MRPKTICLALTGASGMPYGLRLLQQLLLCDIHVQLLYTAAAQIVARQETDVNLSNDTQQTRDELLARFPGMPGKLSVYGRNEWFAPLASGSNPPDAMVICPCTMGTLASIAHGCSDNLLERAADVVLKERRTLIIVPRETPFSLIHLENMLKLTQAGAIILPPNPGFYTHPTSVDDIVDFVVGRMLDQLKIPHRLHPRWGEATDLMG